jgi:methylglutaconyl-CoA hydratase
VSPGGRTPSVSCTIDHRGVASVVLDRPEANNAYDDGMLTALRAVAEDVSVRPELRVVVVTGAGRHFQAGADLRWVDAVRTDGPEANLEASRLTAEALWCLASLPVPVIGLVHGACIGGGTGIAASCDIVVAAEDAYFSIAEARWGLQPSIVLPQLTQAMSPRQVGRFALTGERFSAGQAAAYGLVHDVVPADRLASRGEELVAEVLRNGPQAVRATKSHTRWSAGPPTDPMHPDLRAALVSAHAEARQSDEAAEGLEAFRDRRAPRWAADRAAGPALADNDPGTD